MAGGHGPPMVCIFLLKVLILVKLLDELALLTPRQRKNKFLTLIKQRGHTIVRPVAGVSHVVRNVIDEHTDVSIKRR
jgi:hypothetical protein